jgi:hypothetical protein
MFLGTMIDDVKNVFYASSFLGSFEDAKTFNLGTVIPVEIIEAAKKMRSETDKNLEEQGVTHPPHAKTVEQELVLDESSLSIFKMLLALAIIMGIIDFGIMAVALVRMFKFVTGE